MLGSGSLKNVFVWIVTDWFSVAYIVAGVEDVGASLIPVTVICNSAVSVLVPSEIV